LSLILRVQKTSVENVHHFAVFEVAEIWSDSASTFTILRHRSTRETQTDPVSAVQQLFVTPELSICIQYWGTKCGEGAGVSRLKEGGLEERRKFPQRGLERSPNRKRF